MKIKAHSGKAISAAKILKEVSELDLTECVHICKGEIEFPEECFTEFCDKLGNPDQFFELVE